MLLDPLDRLWTGGRSDHSETCKMSELCGNRADSTGCSDDQDTFLRILLGMACYAQAVKKCLPGGNSG